MLKQLVLEAVVDVFLDDDVFFVSLWGGKREETLEFIDQCGTEGGGGKMSQIHTPSHSQGSPYASSVSG